ncbi:MAG: DUF4390 domain-containing protein [Candidatus Eisenbacteria bacterium]|nr:DUF4390 domain-containing protein [Candidatus Eisenbacteria bacterium]
MLLVLGALAAAGGASALEMALDPPRERAGYVWMDVRLSDLLAPRVAESLARGMPATLALHAETWRRRAGWFDRLEGSFDAAIRIRYEVWGESYRIERAGSPPVVISSLDSVRAVLERPLALPVERVGRLRPGQRYYVVVSAALKPLSVEDVAEVEGWLSGEVREKGRSGFGIVTGLPRSVFDAVRNFAGLGDQRARAISPDFDLVTLFPQP